MFGVGLFYLSWDTIYLDSVSFAISLCMVSGSTENFGMNKISTPENFVSLHLGYGRREKPKENDRNVRNDRVCDSSPGARSGRSATADRVCDGD